MNMIKIEEKKDCCGCNACYDVCPKSAIRLQTDIEGFWYPKVDDKLCIDCSLCEKVCPIIQINNIKRDKLESPLCYGAIHKNIETRFASTSGGVFSALAEEMYKRGGYVGGAIYDNNWIVKHYISNNPEDLKRLRQSKYSQSDTSGFFKEVRELLKNGKEVLVCGTPCQMAGLRSFLQKDYDNLIIVDFICKSITSPKFYHKHLDYWERKAKSKLISFKFKDKELGWRTLTKRYDFQNGKTIYSNAYKKDISASAYHGNIVSRPSCYDCRFKGFPRLADITLGDFWGCERMSKYNDIDDNAGTSAVIINTNKGIDYFETVKNRLKVVDSDISEILPGNPALISKQQLPKSNRDEFFKALDTGSIEDVVPKFVPWLGGDEDTHSFKKTVKTIVRSLYRAAHLSQYHPLVFLRFLHLNLFCNSVKTQWSKGALIYLTPHSVVEIRKGGRINLNGDIIVGVKKLKKSHAETKLLVEEGGVLNVTTYFHIFYGNDIEVLKGGIMNIGQVGTNYGCTIICGKKIDFIGHVAIGRDVSIRDTNAHIIAVDGYKVARPVKIEDHTWLCSGSSINPGVKVHTGAIVGAYSFVVTNVPPHTIVSGNPAKVVEKNIAWKL